jgi:hypothetical protein
MRRLQPIPSEMHLQAEEADSKGEEEASRKAASSVICGG